MDEGGRKQSRTVAAAAAANVDGYLRNASKRVRVPTADGGRGTRRKLAMVTAADMHTPPQSGAMYNNNTTTTTISTINNTTVSTMPGTSTTTSGNTTGDAHVSANPMDVDDEWDEVLLPQSGTFVKKDETKPKLETPLVAHAGPPVKTEALQVDVDSNDEDGRMLQVLMDGARPPLSNTPLGPHGSSAASAQIAAAEITARERRQMAAAARRLERIRRAATGLSRLIFVFLRGRALLRESRHPQLVRRLLRMRGATRDKHFPLLHAAQTARETYVRALNPNARRLVLAPCWVTATRDTVNNYTSAAITSLLGGIAKVFALDSQVDMATLADWAVPIQNGVLSHMLLQRNGRRDEMGRVILSHSLYLCVVFLSLATLTGMSCRLVMGINKEKEPLQQPQEGQINEDEETTTRRPMSLFAKKGRKRKEEKTTEDISKKKPSSCFWVEVWCPQREIFISVNPCEGCATLWGAPYTFSIGGDVIVDVTPRYSTKYSTAFTYRFGRCDQYRFFWKNIAWNDSREASQVIVDAFCKDLTKVTLNQLERERKQLHSLAYAEEIPKTLTALCRHPLFVLETDLARHEGIYPKDQTTEVGSVKGHTVYKRSAIVHLRSRDGWLREGRCVANETEEPYKLTPPPASRPFSSPAAFFGVWQTEPFAPLPLRSDGTIPLHGKTSWYILLDKPSPEGLVHLQYPNIARVARRVGAEFGLAVMGFSRRRVNEHRYGHWEVVINGIVVKSGDATSLVHAYNEWRQLMEEQEAAKRQQRSNRWWMHFAQRLLALQRVREQYLEGAMHGALPMR